MSMIVPLILEAIRAKLQDELITQIPTGTPSRASIVKIGRFQDDPTLYPISVSISPGDQDDPDYRDGIVTLDQMHNLGFDAPAREIGGGQIWWRRGIIKLQCFYVIERYAESVALGHAFEILGRIENCIETIPLNGITDSYGEQAIAPFLYGNTFFESGGPPADYIWRGKILWSVLTYRPHPIY